LLSARVDMLLVLFHAVICIKCCRYILWIGVLQYSAVFSKDLTAVQA